MSYPEEFIHFCTTLPEKLTSLRKNILYILWKADKPLKAYDILQLLLTTKDNSKPPTVYRVLDYFVAAGLVHKIESIQCYTLCQEHEKHHQVEILMLCNQCHQVQEIYDKNLHIMVNKLTHRQGFALSQHAIELNGICRLCQEK